MEINVFQIALAFLGGFGLFMFGMDYMGEGLQKAAGNKMKNLLSVLTSNPFLGVLVGAGVTAIIQSSSATTVMVVGFVNAGLMSLRQAVGVIMGANIGTTVTAWIVSLGDWAAFLKPSTIAPLCIGVGVIMVLFCKKQKVKQIGQIVFGFGALFLGLDLMGDAVKPISQLEEVKQLFVTLGSNPILGILVGAIVTAVIQSSSASVGILQTLAASALVPWNTAIYIILGQNIGTTITAMLSSIGAGRNGKRAAVIHLLFNVIGSIVFAILAVIAFGGLIPAFADFGRSLIDTTQISIVHSVFNILNTILLFPFAGVLVTIAEKLVRGKGKDDESESELKHLDERILETPSFAVQNATKEVVRMGEMSAHNAKLGIRAIFEKDEAKIQEVFEREKVINQLQHGINHYLIKLSNLPISEAEHGIVNSLFHTVSDIERVGDHAENLAELAQIRIRDEVEFSETALKELETIATLAIKCFETAVQACEFDDRNIAKEVQPMEQQVDTLEEELRARHIKRLSENKCSSMAGVVFLDAISNLERISDHASNIGNSVLDEKKILTTSEVVQ
ncbi:MULTISPECIES: Na/Pi cotransporter family protein [Zhenhengia]|jgi:phosphate:Na+ symporter|uniref:Na/Pi cotransporter family protein n=1 Tax=Zhenhengia TaxID=2944196 RepID=UPI0015A8EB74|nr:Na/Pi symporter [Zhenhengia yiwuensis]MBS5316535.1 Na/Pi cotransporter family protein [Clostridiales bacterium]MDU6359043.1 Na/Pi cotransporter family protein [Clostridiales bacterium]MDY3369633.1 Na/Pi cotransporter family protein [Zhenhengia yiwuensis]